MKVYRIQKELAFSLIRKLGPEIIEAFSELQSEGTLPERLGLLATKRVEWNVGDYVTLYDSEEQILTALLFGLLGIESAKALVQEIRGAGPEVDISLAEEITKSVVNGELDSIDERFPEDSVEIKAREAAFESMSEEEKREELRRSQYLVGGFLAWFHEIVSVLVNGQKLSELVPAAGYDDEAFFKAYHIDRYLSHGHPVFRARIQKAHEVNDERFLRRLSYHTAAPIDKGRIKFPMLYVIFALLETLNWLEDCRRSEIVELCDDLCSDRRSAGLADESYVSRRLREYRRYQRKKGTSRH